MPSAFIGFTVALHTCSGFVTKLLFHVDDSVTVL